MTGLPITDEARALARQLWDYHVISEPLERADFVLALGSHDERVAIHAASLVMLGLSPLLVTAGGGGKVTADLWETPEAERYAEVAKRMGVPEDAVMVESQSTNTGENIAFVRDAFTKRNEQPKRGILVSKPYMARRARATARKQWPVVEWLVSPPPFTYDAYSSSDVPEGRMINLLVGDLQRMWLYAEQGFQAPEDVPAEARRAYGALVELGFDQFVLPEG